jgi:hypothetical protein
MLKNWKEVRSMRGTFSGWIRSFQGTGRGVTCEALRKILRPRPRAVRKAIALLGFCTLLTSGAASASIDDAIASALRTSDEYLKQGFVIHQEDEWGGDLGIRQFKTISHLLVQGNDYWFCLGTDVDDARVDIHVYNQQGQLIETEAWQDGSHAAAEAVNPPTANYYIVVQITSSPTERTHWAMVYGTKAVGAQKPL